MRRINPRDAKRGLFNLLSRIRVEPRGRTDLRSDQRAQVRAFNAERLRGGGNAFGALGRKIPTSS